MDVGDWLRSLGLGRYEATFRENEIDTDILPELTEIDLEKLGVPLGHRKRLLKAIASLAATEKLASASERAPVRPDTDAAERRHLTVMFCDLAGSTALSARLDPEDMREVIRAYQDACSGAIARYDGFVAKFMGDGILAYFGYPRAHEDEAERAARAGLEIAAAIAKLETRARDALQVRIGIATGLVVVGDLVGEGSAREQAVVGDAPNLAARLQGLAEPGSIVVAASTRRLLGDLFRLRDLGLHRVKGLADPVEAWVVEGMSLSESRFDAAHTARLTGFVGRESESALLLDRRRLAWQGEGQIVLISGEAGIGKSRFAAWLAEQIGDEPHTRLRYQCSPYHRDSALYPFIAQLERAARIGAEETPEWKLDKLEALLAMATSRVKETAPLFASLLSIPLGSRYPALGLSPAQQRRQTLSAILDQMEGLARQKPMLVLFEDAHWADATSLEVLDLGMERVRRLPVLFLITFRPEFEPPWKGLPNVTGVGLGRLDRGQIETLVETVTGGRKLPSEVMAQIVAKTDGVPLFIEELTKNVQESGLLIEDGDHYRLDGPLPPLAIPATLQDSLMARLDRLAPVKEIAQIGAAIGREFSYALLSVVAGRDEASLKSALSQLEDAELLYRSGAAPDARYSFKHALVQDTAYESLLKSRRQVLHRRIAETLREKFANTAAAEPELVAHHFTEAGLTEPAIEWWGTAGDQALHRSAFKEAIAHLGKAIEMTEKLAAATPTAPQCSERLRLQIAYGNALISARGYQAWETTAAFARARELAANIEDSAERYSAYYGAWASSYVRGELAPMREIAEEFLRDAECRPGLPEASVANRVFGGTCWFQGDFVAARRHLEQALAGYDPKRDCGLAFRFGQDVVVSAMINLAHVLWPLGELERARRLVEEALALAMQSGHVPTMAYGQYYKCLFEAVARDAARAMPHADALVSLSREHGLPFFLTSGTFYHGWTDWHAGNREGGMAEMRQGIALAREHGIGLTMPLYGLLLAEAEAEVGQVEASLTRLDDLLTEIERTGQRWIEAQLNRMRGELLIWHKPAETAAAEGAFMRSLAVARRQQTKTFELQAASSLARLWRSQGRRTDACDLLAPVYSWFTEGFDTLDLTEAKGLLGTLASA
jgi:class 3 adenylate cyclase/predicted ATPase